jgi:hypothetical protein
MRTISTFILSPEAGTVQSEISQEAGRFGNERMKFVRLFAAPQSVAPHSHGCHAQRL